MLGNNNFCLCSLNCWRNQTRTNSTIQRMEASATGRPHLDEKCDVQIIFFHNPRPSLIVLPNQNFTLIILADHKTVLFDAPRKKLGGNLSNVKKLFYITRFSNFCVSVWRPWPAGIFFRSGEYSAGFVFSGIARSSEPNGQKLYVSPLCTFLCTYVWWN